jgi:hypothetical protein
MLHRVALVIADVSEEPSASIIRVTANVVSSSPILVTHMIDVLGSSESSVLTRTTPRNIPVHGILHSHHRGNLKSFRMDLHQEVSTWLHTRWVPVWNLSSGKYHGCILCLEVNCRESRPCLEINNDRLIQLNHLLLIGATSKSDIATNEV